MRVFKVVKAIGINKIRMADVGPEKAGVGGSIPSLATKFNNLQAFVFKFGCNWLHFRRRFLISRPLLVAFLGCLT
jgi:hypothetical protein